MPSSDHLEAIQYPETDPVADFQSDPVAFSPCFFLFKTQPTDLTLNHLYVLVFLILEILKEILYQLDICRFEQSVIVRERRLLFGKGAFQNLLERERRFCHHGPTP